MSAPRFGRARKRAEDPALLRGQGRYTGDIRADAAAMAVLRTPVAAGWLRRLDVAAAQAAPGVLAVLTGAHMEAAGIRPLPPRLAVPGLAPTPFLPLVQQRICRVGEPLAVVIAGTEAQALDALELIEPEIEETDPVLDASAALASGAPQVWPDGTAPERPAGAGNLAFEHLIGDAPAVEAALAEAAHVVRARLEISRVTAMSLEPRGILVRPEGGGFVVHAGVQSVHRLRDELAAATGIAPDLIRVIGSDTGGGFGMKMSCYPEYVLALWAARQTGQAVRWTAGRVESFLSDSHAREQSVSAALALDAKGRMLALDVDLVAPMGAQLGQMSAHSAVANLPGLTGMYGIPAARVRVRGVHVNTQYMAPYRGAGRPEAIYVIERMVDIAAARLGLDRLDLRRRNLIAPGQMPWTTPLGYHLDSGDFPRVMAAALDAADHAGFAARRAEAASRGRLRGLGLACAVEIAGGPLSGVLPEFGAITLCPDTGAALAVGAVDTGQGHATSFSQMLEALLGWPADEVRVARADTAEVAQGMGSFGSRSMAAAGTALARAADTIIAAARADAAELLEVAAADLVFDDGRFAVAGTDIGVTLQALVRTHGKRYAADTMTAADAPTFPNGAHVCEVEVDPETGALEVVAYTVADDFGTVVNPVLVKGQVQGGVAQGLGQALSEAILHDPQSGQVLTASLMDYAVPRAADLPFVTVRTCPTPTMANPLGIKGVGEAGTVGALVAGINAVCDALAPLGVEHLDMPASPHRIWAAIRAAQDTSNTGGSTP